MRLCHVFKYKYSNYIQVTISKSALHRKVNMSTDIRGMRAAYMSKSSPLLEENILIKEPISQFGVWFNEARNNAHIIEPNAMCLATATKNGIPSARFVLLKGYSKDGFEFFTHYASRKGKELEENPFAALTFYWDIMHKSIRIEGKVKKLDIKIAEEYFHSRPRDSQIGSLASKQSTAITSRKVLIEKEEEIKHLYQEKEVPLPTNWGGYILVPDSLEFWQGQTDRLHDRIRFRKAKDGEETDEVLTHKGEDGWIYERLSP